MSEPRRMLVVCTANLCRSPVAAALLARRLDGLLDVDGREWTVSSAGIDRYEGGPESDTVAAASALGIDTSRHVPRQMTRDDIARADLVVTMTRSQLRTIVAADPDAWPKTFTLRELVRRATLAPRATEGFENWLKVVATNRRAADLLKPSPEDDVTDPFRRGRAANQSMVAEVDQLVTELISWGPWRPLKSSAPVMSS